MRFIYYDQRKFPVFFLCNFKKYEIVQTKAYIISSAILPDDSGILNHSILYNYKINEKVYFSKRRNPFGDFTSFSETKDFKEYKYYESKKTIKVYYLKLKPDYSWTETEITLKAIFGNLIFIIIFVFGLWGFISTAIEVIKNFIN